MRFQHQGQRPAERQRQIPACERHTEMLQSARVALPVHHPHLAARPGLEVRCITSNIQNFFQSSGHSVLLSFHSVCFLGMDVSLIVALMLGDALGADGKSCIPVCLHPGSLLLAARLCWLPALMVCQGGQSARCHHWWPHGHITLRSC